MAWLAALISLDASDLLYDHAAQLPDRASVVSLVHAITSHAAFVVPEAALRPPLRAAGG